MQKKIIDKVKRKITVANETWAKENESRLPQNWNRTPIDEGISSRGGPSLHDSESKKADSVYITEKEF